MKGSCCCGDTVGRTQQGRKKLLCCSTGGKAVVSRARRRLLMYAGSPQRSDHETRQERHSQIGQQNGDGIAWRQVGRYVCAEKEKEKKKKARGPEPETRRVEADRDRGGRPGKMFVCCSAQPHQEGFSEQTTFLFPPRRRLREQTERQEMQRDRGRER
jgi:hypothetical protein